MAENVWVAMLDLGQGIKEPVHAFGSADEAERYRAWVATRTGDTCYIAELPLEGKWGDEA